ncbi:hypothetical protein B0H94_10435 [Salsuginibacillus halophilus]|uniref:Peptidase A2 domain-containing protein n=1 Tax=Salsuginibacillus halophilus TaxID=517424 RepID=A0A2P8HQE9_9BACI|nr:pectate lyase-like adhesive domain-containing protein [Salsuginibacillus halophilus]PSL48435.1 hypothetical protein B0H94_10435 [Salsuginibacillus halophilus]
MLKASVGVLFAAVACAGFAWTAAAETAPPYNYDFEPIEADDADFEFNQIDNLNKMVVDFDYELDAEAAPSISTNAPGLINHVERSGNTLEIYFTNRHIDSFLDYSCVFSSDCTYYIEIPPRSLTDDQPALPVEGYQIPFQLHDIIPGFKSTLMDADEDTANAILDGNPPVDINIHVPEMFMTNIETIHRYAGITDSADLRPITNIDIEAADEVHTVHMQAPNGIERHLQRHDRHGYFTTGTAGIEADEGEDGDSDYNRDYRSVDEIQLDAYDAYGRYLERRSFKLRVRDTSDDFIIDDYITDDSSHFGQTYTLYELMEDETLLQEIVEELPASQLDHLGVTYANRNNMAQVDSFESFTQALDDPDISTIELTGDIQESSDVEAVELPRDLTIVGNGHTLDAANLVLGSGSGETLALRDLNLEGGASAVSVYIDTGADGTAILDDVDIDGNVMVESLGNASGYFHNVAAHGVDVYDNDTHIRISGDSELASDGGDGLHVREGENHTIDLHADDIRIATADGASISRLTAYGENTEVAGGSEIDNMYGHGLTSIVFEEEQSGDIVREASREAWEDGVRLMIEEIQLENGTTMHFGQADITWVKESYDDLDGHEDFYINWNESTNYLELQNVDGNGGTVEFTAADGGNYNVTLDVTITN